MGCGFGRAVEASVPAALPEYIYVDDELHVLRNAKYEKVTDPIARLIPVKAERYQRLTDPDYPEMLLPVGNG